RLLDAAGDLRELAVDLPQPVVQAEPDLSDLPPGERADDDERRYPAERGRACEARRRERRSLLRRFAMGDGVPITLQLRQSRLQATPVNIVCCRSSSIPA